MKRFTWMILLILALLPVTVFAKKPLAIVRSQKTADNKTSYPYYIGDFDFFQKWLSNFANFDVISDADVEAGALKNYQAILLPDNAVMGEDEVERYLDFFDRGGKIFGCNSTSLRDADYNLTPYLLSDIFGVTWIQWVNAKDKHSYVKFGDHTIFEGIKITEGKTFTPATQIVNLNEGTPIATWLDADQSTPSQSEEKNACIIENDGNIFVTFAIIKSIYLNDPTFGQLMKNIIAYMAPDAIK